MSPGKKSVGGYIFMTSKLTRNNNRTSRVARVALTLGLAILPAMLAAPPAKAQTFKLLYAFTGGLDGGGPWGTPLLTGGILYATTLYGGNPSPNEFGSVFEFVLATNTGTYLYDFAGSPYDAAAPMSGLITDGMGNFFGTSTQGGFLMHGTVYQIGGGTEFPINSFNGSDGAIPEGGLFMDAAGDLYGTTSQGGANDCGTVWAFSAFGSFVPLYSFGSSQTDGVNPASGVVLVLSPSFIGSVYGTTTEGGSHNWGTIYSVNLMTKAETILYDFRGGAAGGTPVGGLVYNGKGDFYGTASQGGSADGTAGNGVVFGYSLKNKAYKVLHTFTGPDGSEPLAALTPDGQGNYYGTTFAGGAHGYGTVFKMSSAGTLTTLYSFANGTDGAYPYGGVTLDSSGNVYGAATGGGQHGWGTLFEITP